MTSPAITTLAGYGSTPTDRKDYGYRSNKIDLHLSHLLGEGSTQTEANRVGPGTNIRRIRYNGFNFPPVSKSRATIVPEYDDSGRHVKYHTIALTVEAIITPYFLEGDSGNSTDISSDAPMRDLRKRLGQAGQELIITGQGLGNIWVKNTPAGTGGGDQNPQPDLDYGPKPQVVEWEPIGGNRAVRIEWLCTTRIAACPDASVSFPYNSLIQLNSQIDWAIDPAGFMERKIQGMFELAKWFTSSTTDSVANQDVIRLRGEEWEDAVRLLRIQYPLLPGFKRQVSFTLSRNRKVTNYTITDTEYRSGKQPLPPGIISLDMTQKLQAKLKDSGFRKWNMTISGEVEVPNEKEGTVSVQAAKKLAWIYIGLILQDKIDNVKSIGEQELLPEGIYYDETSGEPDDYRKKADIQYLLKNIEITDEMWGNTFSFSLSWMIVCPHSLLFRVTGLFDEIKIQNVPNWDKHRDYLIRNGVLQPSVRPTPENEVVMDICHPLIPEGDTQHKSEPKQQSPGYTRITHSNDPKPGESWLDYKNEIATFTDEGTIVTRSLMDDATPGEDHNFNSEHNPIDGLSGNLDNLSAEGTINSQKARNRVDGQQDPAKNDNFWGGTGTGYYDQEQATPLRNTHEVTYVRMIGYAVRQKYRITPPSLVRVGGMKVKRISRKVFPTKEVIRSTDTLNRVGTVIHTVYWDMLYMIEGTPQTLDAETSGVPQVYT